MDPEEIKKLQEEIAGAVTALEVTRKDLDANVDKRIASTLDTRGFGEIKDVEDRIVETREKLRDLQDRKKLRDMQNRISNRRRSPKKRKRM